MKTLGIIPSVMVWQKNGTFYYDRKFHDGIMEYCKHWKGDVKCLMRIAKSEFPKFGVVAHNESTSFDLDIINANNDSLADKIKNIDVVLVSGDSFDFFQVAKLCDKKGIGCVYIIENTLNTRMRIAQIECDSRSVVKLYKTYLYLLIGEYKRRRAFALADGLQANGVGSYNAYRTLNKKCILYFDTRVREKDLISRGNLMSRISAMSQREIRIGYSGRLSSIKGVEDIIDVARILRLRKLRFKIFIYGDGELYGFLQKNITNSGLSDVVILKGAVPFYEKLLPELKRNIDIFFLPHKQGDPSCTYLETLSCGIPIIGYDNEAFSGLMKIADVGWVMKSGDVSSVANKIIELSNKKEEVAQKSMNAISFAQKNHFENTFEMRLRHLIDIASGK